MADTQRPSRAIYVGLFFVTLATLMHEILLTRIFSVAMWYHFAFIAISVAMFGMTAGAIVVYLRPKVFTVERARHHLAVNSLTYALTSIVCSIAYLQIPFDPGPDVTPGTLVVWGFGYLVIAVPFVFSGITVAIALTKFPSHVNRLYAADLLGAALGCLVLIWALDAAGGATTLFVVATLAAVGAASFSRADSAALRRASVLAAVVMAAASLGHGALERENRAFVQIEDALKTPNESLRYVRWNSHSRVAVSGNPLVPVRAAGWGLSRKTKATEARVPQMMVTIDTFAATPITFFTGDTEALWFMKDDVTNMVHHIRHDGDVAVVGVGGGRDVLSALAFGQSSVLGVEINKNVLRAITEVFGDFAGNLHQHPKVTLVADEARSYITRSDKRFDVIQLSLIDTFAATAAGAFVLTENSLYTAEAWHTFLSRLKPKGVLTVSRWFYPARPAEALRLTSLAREGLRRIGVDDPRRNVVMVKAPIANGVPGQLGSGVANVMVSPDPFTEEDVTVLKGEAERLGFEVAVTPDESDHPAFKKILWESDPTAFYESYPLDLSPPTDDRPFFFNMLRFSDYGDSLAANMLDPNHGQLKAIRLLVGLLVVVGFLTTLCIVIPLVLGTKKGVLAGNKSLLFFFFCIGLGFMFVEMSQMQRLMVMLGHPTYALSVVLFTLLVGTGLGSFASERVVGGALTPRVMLGILVGVLVVFGLVTPYVVEALSGKTNVVRIGTAAAMLFGAGLFLGMPFPLGMRAASNRAGELMPWLWGINGAASVLCTVIAAAVALSLGISASFWAGVACYVGAFVALPTIAEA